jgi:adenylate cyclase
MGEIASQLGVEAILEGTVSRSGSKVRVTTQLIYTPTDAHLWAESYVRDVNDVFDLQKDVARSEAHPDNASLHFGIAETYKYKHMDKESLGEYEIASLGSAVPGNPRERRTQIPRMELDWTGIKLDSN